MASADANELEEQVKSTGNDDSDKYEEVDLAGSKEGKEEEQKDVSAKNEVTLQEIIENPDRFPNMINIMIAMNKFPIDGGSVAKFLGNKFKQPVTPDTADKLLASVLLDMFRKISNDLNGIVLFDNGEIDDEKSIMQAMEQGIPVPPGVNKETFEDKYRVALEIIRKDAEIFSVSKFVDDYVEKSLTDKYSEYSKLDEIINPYLFNSSIGKYLAYSRQYYNINNVSKEKKEEMLIAEFKEEEKKLEEDFREDKLMDIVRLRHGDSFKENDETSPEDYKDRLERVSRMRNLSLAKFGELAQTGKIPGKTVEEQIDNATMMIFIFELHARREGAATQLLDPNDDYRKRIEIIVEKLKELTNGEMQFGANKSQYLADIARYKAQKNGEISDPDAKLTDEQVDASILGSMRSVSDKIKYNYGIQLFLALEAMKKGRLDPRLITQSQNQLLEKCPEIMEQISGIYKIGERGYTKEGSDLLQDIRDDILRTSLDREMSAIENALKDKNAEITPDQRAFYGKVLLIKLHSEKERTKKGIGTAFNANALSNMDNETARISELLKQLYPEVERESGHFRPSRLPVMQFAKLILNDANLKSVPYDKLMSEMEDAYMGLYCYDTLLPNVDLLLEQTDKINDEAFQEMWNKSQSEINVGSRAYEQDRLAKYTKGSRVDFQGLTSEFEKVYKTQYVNSWVTPENVVHLRYIELKLKHAQLKQKGAKNSELKEIEDQMRQMELTEGDELKEAFGSGYEDVSFDGYLHTIDGNLDGHVDAIKAAAKGDKSDVGAVMFAEAVTFNRMKLESRVCQYFFANVFRDKAENQFTLTLEKDLKEHMEYCIYALNMAKNYESEAKNNPQNQADLMKRKELFEKMAQRGLELISKGRKKPYIEFDEDGKATINEDNIARRYCKAAGKKYTTTEAVLDDIYKDGMTLYPARKLDEYYGMKSQLKTFKGLEQASDFRKFDEVIFPEISEKPNGKPDPRILSTFQLSKLNYNKIISCLRDRGFASTFAICMKKTLYSFNLRNKNSWLRQTLSKAGTALLEKPLDKLFGRYDRKALPEGEKRVEEKKGQEVNTNAKKAEVRQEIAQPTANEKKDFVQHVDVPGLQTGPDKDNVGDPQQPKADQRTTEQDTDYVQE